MHLQAEAIQNYAKMLRDQGDEQNAQEMFARAERIRQRDRYVLL
jgi:hypothetical protein